MSSVLTIHPLQRERTIYRAHLMSHLPQLLILLLQIQLRLDGAQERQHPEGEHNNERGSENSLLCNAEGLRTHDVPQMSNYMHNRHTRRPILWRRTQRAHCPGTRDPVRCGRSRCKQETRSIAYGRLATGDGRDVANSGGEEAGGDVPAALAHAVRVPGTMQRRWRRGHRGERTGKSKLKP